MTRRRLATLSITVALLAAACGGDDDGGAAPDAHRLAAGDDFSVVGALAEVPAIADDGLLQVSTADLLAASEAVGVERPDGATDPGWYDWLNAISGGVADDAAPVFVGPPDDVLEVTGDPAVLEEAVGFSFFDADAFVTASVPPTRFTVHAGTAISEVELGAALVEVVPGVVSADDGADLEADPTAGSPADRLGRAARYAQRDGRIVASSSTPMAAAWASGDEATLADDESLAAVAAALDDADAISAIMFRFGEAGPGLDPRASDEAREELAAIGLLEPFGALGLGWAVGDEGEAVMTAVYDFGDADRAHDAADVVETAFREAPRSRRTSRSAICSRSRAWRSTAAPSSSPSRSVRRDGPGRPSTWSSGAMCPSPADEPTASDRGRSGPIAFARIPPGRDADGVDPGAVPSGPASPTTPSPGGTP